MDLLDEKQAAAHLSLSPKTLQKWRWEGAGPRYVKLGAAVRYRPEDLQAWLQAQTRTSTSDAGHAR